MMMRAAVPVIAAGLVLVGLTGCVEPDPYRASSYRPAPTTTTTTTVVRDAYGNPLSTAETVRDGNGNTMSAASPGVIRNTPGYYQNVPGYSPQPYPRY